MGLEAPARQRIDELLAKAGWSVQDPHTVNLYTGIAMAGALEGRRGAGKC